ncbi:MAG: hypothetical protein IPK18_02995 [Sphingobacteriales bacterium]|nr:MAG: hypothetical protein IPK18_02995 [Sphingobacteriales bacterium]
MKKIISKFSYLILISFSFIACNPNEVPQPSAQQKYFIDSIQVFVVAGNQDILVDNLKTNDSLVFASTNTSISKTYRLYDRSSLYAPTVGLLDIDVKSNLINYISYYTNDDPGNDLITPDSMFFIRDLSSKLTQYKYKVEQRDCSFGDCIDFNASVNKNITYSDNSINTITASDFYTNEPFYINQNELKESYTFDYSTGISNDYSMIGFNINDFILSALIEKLNTDEFITSIGIQKLLLANNVKIESTPSSKLPNKITVNLDGENTDIDIIYTRNTSKGQ